MTGYNISLYIEKTTFVSFTNSTLCIGRVILSSLIDCSAKSKTQFNSCNVSQPIIRSYKGLQSLCDYSTTSGDNLIVLEFKNSGILNSTLATLEDEKSPADVCHF